MSIASCDSPIESGGRENQIYRETGFPITCYHDDLTRDSVPWHWHEELELLIVTEGNIIAAAEEDEFPVKKGDGFFVNSGYIHAMWNRDKDLCRLHSMVFDTRLLSPPDQIFFEKYISPVMENGSLRGLVLRREISWQKEILERAERVWELCRDEPEGYEWLVREELSRIIFTLWKEMPEKGSRDRAWETRRTRLKSMLLYLQKNYAAPITLADLARQASISKSEVLRCFRAGVKTTPIQFLKEYRLSRAAEMLRNSGGSITDIAEQCGFTDTGYFIRAFRGKYHCTPGQFRKAVVKKNQL